MGRPHFVGARLSSGELEAVNQMIALEDALNFSEWLRGLIRALAPDKSVLDPHPEDELSARELKHAAELGVTPADYLAAKRKS
jgi:hypothetical protein